MGEVAVNIDISTCANNFTPNAFPVGSRVVWTGPGRKATGTVLEPKPNQPHYFLLVKWDDQRHATTCSVAEVRKGA